MANATQFWGSAGVTGADTTCYMAQTQTANATCNGNGDGQTLDSAFVNSERFASWKNLSNARLIEGSFRGRTAGAPGTFTAVIGLNAPPAKLSTGFFDIVYEIPNPTLYATGTRLNVNVLAIYGLGPATYGTLKPEEAWNIDTKMDDGSPVNGKIFVNKKTPPVGTDCASSDADNATYDFTQTGNNCSLKMALQ